MLITTSRLIPTTIKSTPNKELEPPPHRRFSGGDISGGFAGAVRNARAMKTHELRVRASVEFGAPSTNMEVKDINGTLSSGNNEIELKAVVSIKKKIKQGLVDIIGDQWFNLQNSIGQGIFIQLVSQDIDANTNSGKLAEAYVTGGPQNSSEKSHIDEYTANFIVPSNFGYPGAILITNNFGSEFFLVEVVLHGFNNEPLYFPANSWIHSTNDNSESRIFFRNQTYLPSQTPRGIKHLRRDDLLSRRGNGKGERKLHEMIYDYALYDDLGNPDKDNDLYRPVLGGPERPFPRRCRTGRPPSTSAPECESRVDKPHLMYIPRDETYEETKQETVVHGQQKAILHNLLPKISAALAGSDIPFSSFYDIDSLYVDGSTIKDHEVAEETNHVPKRLGRDSRKYDIPAVIKSDRFSWLRDNEFARQPLAGVNPVNIELLKEFPIMSKLDPAVYGPQESAITKEILAEELDGISVEEAIKNKRLFIIDYHDYLLPFVNKINELPERKAYASRTIFLYTNARTLRPVAIELSLPPTNSRPAFNHVYTQGHDTTSYWLWKLAQAHVCAGDAVMHQLINHWMKIHACMEVYIIATKRQLSQMHPIYKLLRPHMRYTMQINAIARKNLFNGGGVIEATYNAEKYGNEIASAAYKSMWRFDMEALPADLLRRGMAEEDSTAPCGVKLVIEDYPYAADGLLIWSAINEWVESYLSHFYSDSSSITSDIELQEWWKEIKEKGHADKKDEPWWPKLESKEDLTRILTTMIWLGSGQHAAINFSQYPFGAYIPNRPTIMRKLIPQEDEPEYEKFLRSPQATFLSSLPSKVQAAKVIAVQENACTHSPDEEYLGQEYDHWFDDKQVQSMFGKFSSRLMEIEQIINQRNKDFRLKNRTGAGVPPYELLIPTSGPGITGRGIPNSISI